MLKPVGFLICVLFASSLDAIDSLPTEPVSIGHEPQFVFDNWIVDNHFALKYKTQTVERVFHQPEKFSGNPVIADRGGYLIVQRDEATGKFQLWYQDSTIPAEKGESGKKALAYVESDDGAHWKLPEFNQFEWRGTNQNNIVYRGFKQRGVGGPNLVLAPDKDRQGYRYLLSYTGAGGLRLVGSHDGIHWNSASDTAIAHMHSDTQNAVVYDPRRAEYVFYGRAKHIYRTFRGDVIDTGASRRVARMSHPQLWEKWPSRPQQILIPDELDAKERYHFFYGMPTVYQHGLYWGFLEPFRMNTLIHTELAWSRDGVQFQRLPWRPKLIDLGPDGAWDDSMVFACSHWIEVGDEWWIYYAGWDGPHESRERTPGIGLCKVRKEGLISLHGPQGGGVVVTRSLVWPGGDLMLNADASKGELQVRVSDENRKPIAGFDYGDATALTENSVAHSFRWKEKSLHELKGKSIRLEIFLRDADLYTFRAQAETAVTR